MQFNTLSQISSNNYNNNISSQGNFLFVFYEF